MLTKTTAKKMTRDQLEYALKDINETIRIQQTDNGYSDYMTKLWDERDAAISEINRRERVKDSLDQQRLTAQLCEQTKDDPEMKKFVEFLLGHI